MAMSRTGVHNLRGEGGRWRTKKSASKGSRWDIYRDTHQMSIAHCIFFPAKPLNLRSIPTHFSQAAGGGGLVLATAVPAAADLSILCDKGYRSVGFRGSDKSFLTGGALTHVFCKPESLPLLADQSMTTYQPRSPQSQEVDGEGNNPSGGTSEETEIEEGNQALVGGVSSSEMHAAAPLKGCTDRVAYPETHRHDLSLWIKPEAFHEEDLRTFLTQLFTPHGIKFEVTFLKVSIRCPALLVLTMAVLFRIRALYLQLTEFDRYFDESTGKHSRAFHVDLISHTNALSKAHASQLMRVAATHLGARRPVGFDDHLQQVPPTAAASHRSENDSENGSCSGDTSKSSGSDSSSSSSSRNSSSNPSNAAPLSLPPRLAAAVEGRYRYDLLPTSRGGTAPDEAL